MFNFFKPKEPKPKEILSFREWVIQEQGLKYPDNIYCPKCKHRADGHPGMWNTSKSAICDHVEKVRLDPEIGEDGYWRWGRWKTVVNCDCTLTVDDIAANIQMGVKS